PQRASVKIEGRTVYIRAWRYRVEGATGFTVPVYFLDTDLSENSEWDRTLTHFLYGGDQHYRLCQEVLLGMGGVRMLHALGHCNIERFHMNEGHASLLTIELLREQGRKAGRKVTHEDIEAVRQKCIFTTHTPVAAGHDQFPMEMMIRVIGPPEENVDVNDVFLAELARRVLRLPADDRGLRDALYGATTANMTYLALNLSHYVNGVAKKHGEVSRLMFAEYAVDAITNGVHAATWVAKPFQELYDRYVPGWRQDNFSLRYAMSIPWE